MDANNPTASPEPGSQDPAQASIQGLASHENPSSHGLPKPRADGRKKFTAEQTLRMEMLFRENTHPSREQRFELSNLFNVNEKSVGIWFQNRRQAVRRDRKLGTSKSISSPAPRPSLERVASQIELPAPKPRSIFDASYHRDHTAHVWGHMISSSPSPPVSPNRILTHGSKGGEMSSLSLSRTRSASPTRLTPRLAQNTMTRTHSDIGAQRTRMGKTRKTSRVTLELACANAKRLPSSPLRPSADTTENRRQTRANSKSTIGAETEDDTVTEADTRTEFSEETEALTPSEGQSIASLDVASSTWSPHGSFSSDLSPSSVAGGRTLRRKAQNRHDSAVWLTQSFGRTVRNPNGQASQKGADKSGEPIDVGHTSSTTTVLPSTSSNSPQEIEAALVLCGLFASGRS